MVWRNNLYLQAVLVEDQGAIHTCEAVWQVNVGNVAVGDLHLTEQRRMLQGPGGGHSDVQLAAGGECRVQ